MVALAVVNEEVALQPTLPQFALSAEETFEVAVRKVNATIRRRRQNDRDTLTQALKAGRLLSEVLKPAVEYGRWERFVLEQTDYERVRDAQIDMQVWRAWKPYAEQLVEAGVITSLDAPEDQMMDELDDRAVSISLTAMRQFAAEDVPAIAFDIALSVIQRNDGRLSIPVSQRLIETARVVDSIDNPETRAEVEAIVKQHGIDNPEVVRELPEIVEAMPELAAEIKTTGHVFVPGLNEGEGKQVQIDRASATDLEIAKGRTGIEKELTSQAKTSDYLHDKSTADQFNFVLSAEGTAAQVAAQVQQATDDPLAIWRVVVYRRKV